MSKNEWIQKLITFKSAGQITYQKGPIIKRRSFEINNYYPSLRVLGFIYSTQSTFSHKWDFFVFAAHVPTPLGLGNLVLDNTPSPLQ